MSDAAFNTAAYPAYTSVELAKTIERFENGDYMPSVTFDAVQAMRAEIDRRTKAAAGDYSVMTDGERLRYGRVA